MNVPRLFVLLFHIKCLSLQLFSTAKLPVRDKQKPQNEIKGKWER